jgi:hypothetical protein
MWDKLDTIELHQKKGSSLLNEFNVLSVNFSSALSKFSEELVRCHD